MKDDLAYIEHILEAIEKIQEYTRGISNDQFNKNEMVVDAVIRNIEIIGEASKKVSDHFRKAHNDIPWNEMAGMRDKLIHDYMGVDTEVIWQTIIEDIPILQKQLHNIV